MKSAEMWLLLTREERLRIRRDMFRLLRHRGCIEGYIDKGHVIVESSKSAKIKA